MNRKYLTIVFFLLIVFIIFANHPLSYSLGQLYNSSVSINTDIPKLTVNSNSYIIGDKVVISVFIPSNKGYKFDINKSLVLSKHVLKNNKEKIQYEYIPLNLIDNNYYKATIDTELLGLSTGQHLLMFKYLTNKNQKKLNSVNINIGKISVLNKGLDFFLLNKEGTATASLFLNSTIRGKKYVSLSITSVDSVLIDSKITFDKDIKVDYGRNEFFVKLKLNNNFFEKKQLLLEQGNFKKNLTIYLKNKNGALIAKSLIPINFTIGSTIDYNIDIIVIVLTLFIICGIVGYNLWKNNQSAKLFGTLYCKKHKDPKLYIQKDKWILKDLNTSEACIGSYENNLIYLPLIKPEYACVYAKGLQKNSTLCIKPVNDSEILINNIKIVTDTELSDNDDIYLDGYIVCWHK